VPLTREFRETVWKRVRNDPKFGEELLREGVECLLSGEMETGKTLLRDYINATVGFEKLAQLVELSPKSLMRMFGGNGNPQARNIFQVIALLQRQNGVSLELTAKPTRRARRSRQSVSHD
jgi:DNA-binding phage protein